MKSGWSRDRDGRERLWLTDADIEGIMTDELRRSHLFPTVDRPVVDLERLLEGHLGVRLDQHAALEPTVLGQTEFFLGGPPYVAINRDLTDAAMDDDHGASSVLGRWRATLAHEAAHVVMHRVLFELNRDAEDLFATVQAPASSRLMRCLKDNVLFRGGGSDWREVQANKGMAALLMPKDVFIAIVERALVCAAIPRNALGRDPGNAARIVAHVARVAEVSKQTAEIRLQTLGIIGRKEQGVLL